MARLLESGSPVQIDSILFIINNMWYGAIARTAALRCTSAHSYILLITNHMYFGGIAGTAALRHRLTTYYFLQIICSMAQFPGQRLQGTHWPWLHTTDNK